MSRIIIWSTGELGVSADHRANNDESNPIPGAQRINACATYDAENAPSPGIWWSGEASGA